MSDAARILRGVADYLGSTERSPGVLYCNKHKTEHTGTGAYLIQIEAYLCGAAAGESQLSRAVRVARRVCERVREDPAESYGAWIVLPGSRDPNNHANNAIDCGCAIDALATLGRLHGGMLAKEDLNKIEWAVRQVSNSYIVPHAMPKEILAQRLWSLAALGSAYLWLREPRWREAGLAAIERTYQQQNGDGSFPYTPLGTPRSHPGSADASAFYHSRHALFIAHALLCFGEDPRREPHASRLRAASEFLLALLRADDTKNALVEAKPWYWESAYEVAGFPFDISALLVAGRTLGETTYLHAAARMWRALERHVEPDGGITSHRGAGWNFQCRFFWNAHCAWLAREMETLQSALALGEETQQTPRLRWFPDAGFAQYSDATIVAHVRGRAPRRNLNHGSPVSGGGLLYAAARREREDWIRKNCNDKSMSGEWLVWPEGGPGVMHRFRKALRENRDELRFCLWIARVRARSGDAAWAVLWYLDKLHRGLCAASRAGYSSGFAADAAGQCVETTLAFRGTVADAFGDALPGVTTIRRYVFEPGAVRVGEALSTARALRKCIYQLPPGAKDAAFEGADARVVRGTVMFGNVPAGATLAIRYRL